MAALRFDGKVVLVTGGGNGLGKEYALAFGARGAKVVVNDLGGDIKGGGQSSRAADVVVEQIRAAGGTAAANYDSVEDGDKVVQTALDNFGRIDIVINNAGILRDRSFARTSDLDWDLIQRVHLRGSFMVTRAAWPHMKDNKYGRVIMTSSAAGIYGNFGQANYSAAKLGLVGLGQTLAIEGAKYNIHSNVVAPIAGSRLTETVMPQEMLDALKPEYVVPLVLWLCHEDCSDSGGLFELGGGWFSKLRWERTDGVMLRGRGKVLTPEAVRDNWETITDFSKSHIPSGGGAGGTGGHVYNLVLQANEELREEQAEKGANPTSASLMPNAVASSIDPVKAVGASVPPFDFSYTDKEVMLYALGVGVNTQQEDHLKFLYELHEDFSVLPTMAVLAAMGRVTQAEGLNIDPTQILHGEQYLELYRPLPTSGTITSRGTIADVLDKGSGAVILVNVESFDENGEKLAHNQTSIFVQRAGGFGGKRSSDKAKLPVPAPDRAPDASVRQTTAADQAALYRLSGDRNPLHIDPNFAAMGGFETPILHGLCSFGYAVRHVLQTYAGNDVTKFKAVKVRFSKPVLPGQTIQTDMWQEGSRIHFQCKVADTGAVSLSGAYVDLHGSPVLAAQPTAAARPLVESDVLFKIAAARIDSQPELTKQVNAVFQFNILQDKKHVSTWTVDMKSSPGQCYPEACRDGKPGVTVTMEDGDVIDMATGKLAGPKAFLSGKMKLKGNIMLAQKLGTVFMDKPKL